MSFRCNLCRSPQVEGKVPTKVIAVQRNVRYIYDEERTFTGKEPVKEVCLCAGCAGLVTGHSFSEEKEKVVYCKIKETKKERKRRERQREEY